MPTSDEDLQKKAERVQKLREQVSNAQATREQRERDLANDVTMRQLEAEEAALEARLAVAKDAGKVASVKEGTSTVLDAVTSEMEAAVAQKKAAEDAGKDAARATESTTAAPASGDTSSTAAANTTSGKDGK